MKLNVDIDKLIDVSKRLLAECRNYEDAYKNAVACVEATRTYWEGRDSEKYIKKITDITEILPKLSTVVTQYATFIGNCTVKYKNTDNEIYEELVRISNSIGD